MAGSQTQLVTLASVAAFCFVTGYLLGFTAKDVVSDAHTRWLSLPPPSKSKGAHAYSCIHIRRCRSRGLCVACRAYLLTHMLPPRTPSIRCSRPRSRAPSIQAQRASSLERPIHCCQRERGGRVRTMASHVCTLVKCHAPALLGSCIHTCTNKKWCWCSRHVRSMWHHAPCMTRPHASCKNTEEEICSNNEIKTGPICYAQCEPHCPRQVTPSIRFFPVMVGPTRTCRRGSCECSESACVRGMQQEQHAARALVSSIFFKLLGV